MVSFPKEMERETLGTVLDTYSIMSKVTASEESHTANFRTARSFIGLICSSNIVNGDLSTTSCVYGAEVIKLKTNHYAQDKSSCTHAVHNFLEFAMGV